MDYQKIKRKTKRIGIGKIAIGGDHPLTIQSMTNTDPHNAEATAKQILQLALPLILQQLCLQMQIWIDRAML